MKLDILNLVQITLIFIYLSGIFYFIVYSYKRNFKNVCFKLIKQIATQVLNYSKKLTTKNYFSYEKYCIWRFCVHF